MVTNEPTKESEQSPVLTKPEVEKMVSATSPHQTEKQLKTENIPETEPALSSLGSKTIPSEKIITPIDEELLKNKAQKKYESQKKQLAKIDALEGESGLYFECSIEKSDSINREEKKLLEIEKEIDEINKEIDKIKNKSKGAKEKEPEAKGSATEESKSEKTKVKEPEAKGHAPEESKSEEAKSVHPETKGQETEASKSEEVKEKELESKEQATEESKTTAEKQKPISESEKNISKEEAELNAKKEKLIQKQKKLTETLNEIDINDLIINLNNQKIPFNKFLNDLNALKLQLSPVDGTTSFVKNAFGAAEIKPLDLDKMTQVKPNDKISFLIDKNQYFEVKVNDQQLFKERLLPESGERLKKHFS